jgi:hypothetical protein
MSTAAPSPLAAHVDKLLKVAADNGATELRISGGREPMVRIKDKLVTLKSPALTAEQVAGITAAIVPAGADPKKFVYLSAIGRYQGSAVDVQGTKVLVLQPAGPAEAEPATPTGPGGASSGALFWILWVRPRPELLLCERSAPGMPVMRCAYALSSCDCTRSFQTSPAAAFNSTESPTMISLMPLLAIQITNIQREMATI